MGDARLPSLPLEESDKETLSGAFTTFCAAGGKGLRMCEQAARLAEREPPQNRARVHANVDASSAKATRRV